MKINRYTDLSRTHTLIAQGKHRELVGGFWEEIGKLQFEFLLAHGLRQNMKVLDLGCGCMRVGLHLVDHLDNGNYYGIDISQELLDVGYVEEIGKIGLAHKLPKENLLCDDNFNINKLNIKFDLIFALSLFTHLPLNHIKLCLGKVADHIQPGGDFFATFFLCPNKNDWSHSQTRPGGITTFPCDDPYHYQETDLEFVIQNLPFSFEIINDWGHPRGHSMVTFMRHI